MVLFRLFKDSTTELWLTFVEGNSPIFEDTVIMHKEDNTCTIKSADFLNT